MLVKPGPAGRTAIILLIISLSGVSAAQPQATIRSSPPKVPLNRNLNVTLEIVWSGEADVYDIPRPDTSALAEFEILSHGLATEKRGAENVLRHEFVMQPLKEGEYDMGRIRVQYYEKDRDVPMPIPAS